MNSFKAALSYFYIKFCERFNDGYAKNVYDYNIAVVLPVN